MLAINMINKVWNLNLQISLDEGLLANVGPDVRQLMTEIAWPNPGNFSLQSGIPFRWYLPDGIWKPLHLARPSSLPAVCGPSHTCNPVEKNDYFK